MSFEIKTIELKLTKATKTGQDMSFQRLFQVKSTVDTTVPVVAEWLALNMVRTLGPWLLPEAKLESYTLNETDKIPSQLFVGTAIYEKKNTSLGVADNDAKNATSIRFGESTHEKVVWTARNAEGEVVPVLNSAGDRFAEPLMETEKRIIIYVEKTYAFGSVSPQSVKKLVNSVNLNPITVAGIPIAARSGVMVNVRIQVRVIDVGSFDWRVEFEIEAQDEGTYDRDILDQGLYYWEALGGEAAGAIQSNGVWYRRVPVMAQTAETGDQEKADEPVLLNGFGGRLEDVTPGNEKYVTFRTKNELDWGGLGLPKTIQGVLG